MVCPGFACYRVGEESWYDDQTGTMAERVVATVVTRRKLTTAQQSQAEGLIRIHVPDLDDVEFEVEGGESARMGCLPASFAGTGLSERV